MPTGGQPTHPIHKWRIPSSKGEHVRTNRHTRSAFMPPPPPNTISHLCLCPPLYRSALPLCGTFLQICMLLLAMDDGENLFAMRWVAVCMANDKMLGVLPVCRLQRWFWFVEGFRAL